MLNDFLDLERFDLSTVRTTILYVLCDRSVTNTHRIYGIQIILYIHTIKYPLSDARTHTAHA